METNISLNEDFMNQWGDVTPVPQFSDKVEILKIKYSKKEKTLLDIFRGVLQTKELSVRVYNLTTLVIKYFPTNYVAWVLRRQCINEIKEIDPKKELDWLDKQMVENQKNYQIWHHRKLLIEKLNDASHEKKMLDNVFESEPKNFHAWSHRIWMIRRFNNVEGEFEYIEKMLENDIKNNSVWNYRFFLIQYVNNNKINKDIAEKEIKYAIDKIKKCPINECPYCYIRGYIIKFGYKYSDFIFVKEEVEKLIEKEKNNSYGLMLLMDYYEEEKNEKKFNEVIEELIKIDYIRKKYYGWRKENSIFNNNNKKVVECDKI
jgi:protein farnesyltransferase/geranylgeranyltransferase type-1 subunit alpha